MTTFLQVLVTGLGLGATYALFAQGIVLVYRGSGIVNFAQGALGMLAAYLTFIELHDNAGLPMGVAIAGGIAAAVVVGLLFSVVVLRPLARAAPIARDSSRRSACSSWCSPAIALQYGSNSYPVTALPPPRHVRLGWRTGPGAGALHRGHLRPRHRSAVGAHPVRPHRPRHHGVGRERTCGPDARVVTQPPLGGHVEPRRRAGRARRRPARPAQRPLDPHVHAHRHRHRRWPPRSSAASARSRSPSWAHS